jgi:hypothetical protein
LLVLLALIAAAGCGNEKEDPAEISIQPETFINTVLQTMENESWYRAGFAYLKSIPSVDNPVPPLLAVN